MDGTLALEEQLCRTCTYARSYFVTSRRAWNALLTEICRNSTSLVTFKTLLVNYCNGTALIGLSCSGFQSPI